MTCIDLACIEGIWKRGERGFGACEKRRGHARKEGRECLQGHSCFLLLTSTRWMLKSWLVSIPNMSITAFIPVLQQEQWLLCLAELWPWTRSKIENSSLEYLSLFTASNPTFSKFWAKTSPLHSFLFDRLKKIFCRNIACLA